MDRYFRTEGGELVNVNEHVLDQIKKNPNLKIYIATDSQNYGGSTVYATAVVFRYGLRGAHFIYLKQRIPRVRNHFERLFKEAEFSIQTAQLITEQNPINIEAIEFDFNEKNKRRRLKAQIDSKSVIDSAVGWGTSLGYNCVVKPGEMIAAKAADHVCRN